MKQILIDMESAEKMQRELGLWKEIMVRKREQH